MDLTTLETILVAVAPALSSIITILASVIKISVTAKKQIATAKSETVEANQKVQMVQNDIAIIKAKCESLEKVIIEMKENK